MHGSGGCRGSNACSSAGLRLSLPTRCPRPCIDMQVSRRSRECGRASVPSPPSLRAASSFRSGHRPGSGPRCGQPIGVCRAPPRGSIPPVDFHPPSTTSANRSAASYVFCPTASRFTRELTDIFFLRNPGEQRWLHSHGIAVRSVDELTPLSGRDDAPLCRRIDSASTRHPAYAFRTGRFLLVINVRPDAPPGFDGPSPIWVADSAGNVVHLPGAHLVHAPSDLAGMDHRERARAAHVDESRRRRAPLPATARGGGAVREHRSGPSADCRYRHGYHRSTWSEISIPADGDGNRASVRRDGLLERGQRWGTTSGNDSLGRSVRHGVPGKVGRREDERMGQLAVHARHLLE
jgi:hypothetical protein